MHVLSSLFNPFPLLPHSFLTLKDGCRLRYAQIAPKRRPRGTVLIVPGAREFIEKKYDECGKKIVDWGFRVIIYEPRGQGLSSRFLDGVKRQRNHIDNFSIHIDDLRAFYEKIIVPRLAEPLIVHGHSLGAHILLRWIAEDRPSRVAAAVVTAPMVAFAGMAAYHAAYGLAWMNARVLGDGTDYMPMQNDFGGDDLMFAGNFLTHDRERFSALENYYKAHPDLKTGGVTWGWTLAAMQSMHVLQSWPYLARIRVPVLSLTGDQDFVTPLSEITPFLSMIPAIRLRTISGARHDLMSETDALRDAAWREIEEFLKPIMARERQAPRIFYRLRAGQSKDRKAKKA